MGEEPRGVVVRGLVGGRAVRLLAVEARALAEHTRLLQGLSVDAAALAGEVLVAALLSSAHLKGEEQLTLRLESREPAFAIYVDVTAEGQVRARVTPAAPGPIRGGLEGLLLAIKSLGPRELYRGVTELGGRSVEASLSAHLRDSNQIDAILRLGADVAPDGRVLRAGGILLERLALEAGQPSIDAAAFAQRYGWVGDADRAELLQALAFGQIGEDPVEVLADRPIVWRCRCSIERIEGMLLTLGPRELTEMADHDHGASIRCEFCTRDWAVSEARLRVLIGRAESVS